ncbi:ERCC4 domain-containing protein [Astrocystis sublimbata]|nr:ERCC4 domain-containing protein [Astrocystis sublimbata]
MPAEVISLLSSSPIRATPLEAEKGTDGGAPLAYDGRNTSSQLPTNPIVSPVVGTKRASSYQPHHERRGDDDFLFLADDSATTGRVQEGTSGRFGKRSRTSAGLLHHDKTSGPPDSLKRTDKQPSRGPAPRRESPRHASVKRWGNLVEDIEFSSSPADLVPLVATKRAPDLTSDPFASSQKDDAPIPTPRRATSERLFCSSPIGSDHTEGHTSLLLSAKQREDPLTNGNRDNPRSSKTTFIDLSSDGADIPPPRRNPPPGSSTTRQKAAWDPISSSAPETYDIQDLLSSPPLATVKGSSSRPRATTLSDNSDSSSLPDLNDVDFAKIRATKHSRGSASRPPARVSKQTTRKPVKSTEDREREKRQKMEAKEAERERKRVENLRAREERALQKEKDKAMAEVNKLRTDKKVSTAEMIVDIPANIASGLKVQIEALLGDLNVQYETWTSPVDHVVKWRRKVTSQFDEDMGLWKPMPMRIKDEDHVLVIVQAADFVKFALGEEGHDLEAHVSRMKSAFPGVKTIYLIEGLTPWMRKNRNLLNRQYVSAVRSLGPSGDPGSSSNQTRRRNNNQPQEYIDEDKIEDALLSLQVLHGTLVHHTNAPVETAQWVAVFTQHISTIPYRKARDASADAGFCMESGQVRTGDGAKDTYVHMLQEITRVTAPIAYGIVAKYESVTDLVRGLENEGPLALAECRKSANKDGALTDRTIGPAISRRVHKIFLGRDPASTDV